MSEKFIFIRNRSIRGLKRRIRLGNPKQHTLKIRSPNAPEDEFEISFGDGNFPELKIPHKSQMNTMPIICKKDGTIKALGTCFAISSKGLMVTARHVLDEVIKFQKETRDDDTAWIGALYLSDEEVPSHPEEYTRILLPIENAWQSDLLDIALLKLELPIHDVTGAPLPIGMLPLSPGIPAHEMYCVGMGYSALEISESDSGLPRIYQSYHAARGIIEEIYFPRRDRLLNFPCFLTDARFDLGMSGGPIYYENPGVCGVICSGFNFGENNIPTTSYGSFIGPALALVLEARTKGGKPEKCFLWDLVVSGELFLDATYEQIKVRREKNEIEIDFGHNRIVRNTLPK